VNGLRRGIASIGTKTLLWPLVFANGGTLVCLIFGRSNLVASGLGLASVVLGLVLMMRYAVSQRARANSSNTKAV
jgi:hypothetical protein